MSGHVSHSTPISISTSRSNTPGEEIDKSTGNILINIDPYAILLKDGSTKATIYPISSPNDISPNLLAFLWDEYNMEIEKGETLTFYEPLSFESFISHWFDSTSIVAIMVVGDETNMDDLGNDELHEWPSELLGIFNIKPNFPGCQRSGHICTGEFLVNAGIRGRGIGKTLTDCFMQWALKLGYTYVIFNLILETNVAARKLWESLNFSRLGKINNVAIMGHDDQERELVDGIIYGKSIENTIGGSSNRDRKTPESESDLNNSKFENLKYYLQTGNYPPNVDNKEKSRLRANKANYYLQDDKLMVNGREVVSNIDLQLKICQLTHEENGHLGINRTTTLISQKYHWIRIKETVARALKSCQECKNNSLQAKEEFLNQSNKRIKLQKKTANNDTLMPLLDNRQFEQAVIQAKQRLNDPNGVSYADVARSAIDDDSQIQSKQQSIHPEVKKYDKLSNSNQTLSVDPSVRTYY